ncbi:MAG: hypothetical protein P1V36_00145 [Planctomycetota bacterium]|nr:hypothetical protein [Planctomycetota bacterium]
MPAAVVKTPPTGVYDLSHNGRAGREKTISPSYETENSNVKFAAGFQTQVPQALPDGTPTQDALEGVMQDIMAYTHGEPDAVIGGVSSREYARPTSAGEVPHARGTINVNEDTSRFTPRYAEAYEEAKQGPAMMLQHMSKRLDEMGIDHPPFRDLTSMRKWVRGLHYDLSKQRRLAGPDYVQADQSE